MGSPGKGMGPWGRADRLRGSLPETPPSGCRKGTHTNPLPRAQQHPPPPPWVSFQPLLFSHSGVSSSVTPPAAVCQTSLSFTTSCLLTSTESVTLSNHLILCCPLTYPSQTACGGTALASRMVMLWPVVTFDLRVS